VTPKSIEFSEYPLDLSDTVLREVLAGQPDSVLMRSLLIAEVEAMRAGTERERRTMRYIWYDYIKPVLSRAGLLDKQTKNGKEVDWPGKLSKYLAELVRSGFTTYQELKIVDGSRQRQVAVNMVHTVADVQLTGAHFPGVILFTEKDTIWGEVVSLARLYGVSAISGGGEPSNACTEDTVRAIVKSPALRQARLVVLSLTDYDPFGYMIAEAQAQQVREAAPGLAVVHDRLGLRPEQLTPEERQAKAYKPKDIGLSEWYTETGGVDGEPLGLELDALPLSRLRTMFAEGIERYVDLGQRRDDLRKALPELLSWEVLMPQVETMQRAMLAEMQANGGWQAIQDTAIPDDLFRQAAKSGWDTINPTKITIDGEPLFACESAIRAALSEALTKFTQVAKT